MPQTHAEVTLAGDWAYTLGGEPFILAEEGADDNIILLGTQSNLHHLAEAECLYMDGTFQTCPRLFYQIFSIHIVKYGQTFPMVYGLLPNKQQATYNRMFMMVKEAALNLGLELTPSSVLSDFEQALINSVRLNFPTAQYRRCYYHYSQAIWRKVQASGLQEEYKAEDEILKSFVQKTAAICFIPPAYVRVAWQGLQHEAPDIDRIDDFVEYFDRTWINGQYRISQWNYYDYHGPRTNNHVEGWHSQLKKIVGKSHPNIFEIVDVMRRGARYHGDET